MNQQLTLDLPMRPALNRRDFIVTPCNAEAVALIDAYPNWDTPLQWVYGPTGCGKSHLAAVLAHQGRTHIIPIADIAHHAAVKACLAGKDTPDILLLDGVQHLRSQDEEVLFHLLNAAQHRRQHILLLSAVAPSRLTIHLPDLRSRLLAIPAIAMREPDDQLLVYLLHKLFADRQINVDEKIVAYLVPRVEREYTALASLVEAIDRNALAQKRNVTIPFIADMMTQK